MTLLLYIHSLTLSGLKLIILSTKGVVTLHHVMFLLPLLLLLGICGKIIHKLITHLQHQHGMSCFSLLCMKSVCIPSMYVCTCTCTCYMHVLHACAYMCV